MKTPVQSGLTLSVLALIFLGLAAAFLLNLWGHPVRVTQNALVDPQFTNTATARVSGAELIRTGGDASGLDCYACHDRAKKVELHFDPEGNIKLPDEHNDLVMGHGRHRRNNNCFNCHDEENLEKLQTRDGRQVKLLESTPLCGSCHGPTYRDWEAGAHGRTAGHWLRSAGPIKREACVNCHDPHSPKFPPRKPAPGPNLLHGPAAGAAVETKGH